jgi:ABC-2 type transport system ATP-binding protein
VDGLSFSADAGEVVALLGPNGAGKTTTVEALEGYRRPDGGSVRVLGLDPVGDHARVVERLGAMPQSSRLYAAIRPREALRLFAAYYPAPTDLDELLARVGLAGRRASTPWRRLSGGEQQRLSLALALVGGPAVVALDEPTAGLDVEGRRLVRGIVAELRAAGVCVLITTHELDEVERTADRVVILDGGRLVAAGTLTELAAHAGPPQIRFGAPAGLAPGVLAELSATLEGAAAREVAPGEYAVDAEPSPANVARLTAWLARHDLPLGDLRAGRQRLEDVFVRLTTAADETAGGEAANLDQGGGDVAPRGASAARRRRRAHR